jgi:hypothetical protein
MVRDALSHRQASGGAHGRDAELELGGLPHRPINGRYSVGSWTGGAVPSCGYRLCGMDSMRCAAGQLGAGTLASRTPTWLSHLTCTILIADPTTLAEARQPTWSPQRVDNALTTHQSYKSCQVVEVFPIPHLLLSSSFA